MIERNIVSRLRMPVITALVCALLSVALPATAQVNNRFIYDTIGFNLADSNRAGFSVTNINYLRNTEYYNNIEVGRTLFGYMLTPALYFNASKHVRLEAGLFLRRDFGGTDPYTRVVPTFTLKLRSNNNWNILFGTLEGTINHRMAEPMLDIASYIEKHIENGFEVKHASDKLFFDAWINWEKFIERGATEKEQLTAGLNYQPRLIETLRGFSLTPIAQGMISHRGGQIDKDTISFYVIMNYAAGLRLMKRNSNAFIKELRFEPYMMFYQQTDGNIYPYKGGNAIYLNALAATQNVSLMLSYWQGDSYVAARGTPVYSSVSLDRPGYTEPKRQLLIARLFYEKIIYNQVSLSARLEPFYDLNNKTFDYSYSLYLVYKGSWGFRVR